jgi:hypothetical protein
MRVKDRNRNFVSREKLSISDNESIELFSEQKAILKELVDYNLIIIWFMRLHASDTSI